MEEKRHYRVQRRVFTKADIRRLGGLVDRVGEECATEGYGFVARECEIVLDDETSYASVASSEVLADGSAIDTRRTTAISMEVSAYKGGELRSVRLVLEHGHTPGQLTVRGTEEGWVAQTFFRLKEGIEAARAQDATLQRIPELVRVLLLSLACGYANVTVCLWVLRVLLGDDPAIFGPPSQFTQGMRAVLRERSAFGWAFYLFNITLAGAFYAPFLDRFLVALWPTVELDLGPDYSRIVAARRRKLGLVVTLIVVPILLELLVLKRMAN